MSIVPPLLANPYWSNNSRSSSGGGGGGGGDGGDAVYKVGIAITFLMVVVRRIDNKWIIWVTKWQPRDCRRRQDRQKTRWRDEMYVCLSLSLSLSLWTYPTIYLLLYVSLCIYVLLPSICVCVCVCVCVFIITSFIACFSIDLENSCFKINITFEYQQLSRNNLFCYLTEL